MLPTLFQLYHLIDLCDIDKLYNNNSHHFFCRQPVIPDVPYSRLLDTPSKNRMNRDFESIINRSPPSYATHRPSHDGRLHRSLRISPPKTSASDSRLTVDYFQPETEIVTVHRSPEMSSSAPHSNPLDVDLDEPSIGSTCNSDATLNDREMQVQRTVSLTSENQSEAFYSAEEEMHASQKSGLAKVEGGGGSVPSGKKRFASDLSIGQGDPDARLSSHRSDYEINTPEHRSLPKRPQSTTDMVSNN